jgi:hypothetical protein
MHRAKPLLGSVSYGFCLMNRRSQRESKLRVLFD